MIQEHHQKQAEFYFSRLTDEAKAAQLCGIRSNALMNENFSLDPEKCRKLIPNGIGHLCQFACSHPLSPDALRNFVLELQKWLRDNTPCGIPAAPQEEAISGVAARGATVFPQHLGSACSWNPDLIRRKNEATAESLRKLGGVLALSPMIDLCHSAHWSRIEESFGSDSCLTAVLACAFVQGMHSRGVAATIKHFAGYGSRNENDQEFFEEMLLPHEASIRLAGARVVMPGYHSWHGVPCIANKELLHNVLRDLLGFDGLVISDYGAIRLTIGVSAVDAAEAAIQSLLHGNDAELPAPELFSMLPKLLKAGRLPRQAFDAAVMRTLLFKAEAGLLGESPVLPTSGPIDLNPPEHQTIAREMAEQSIVLLKNDGILPLDFSGRKIVLAGPNANSIQALLGDYTYHSLTSFWWHLPLDASQPKLVTLEEGLRRILPADAELLVERGCDWEAKEKFELDPHGDPRLLELAHLHQTAESFPPPDWERALTLATEADLIIAAVGENILLCGEGRKRPGIRLPGKQEEFVRKLTETGKPVILIIFGGRPQVIGDLAERCSAVIQAFFPGQSGGDAVADLLAGKINFSAKLCVSSAMDEDETVIQYPFGFGLSYTSYDYRTATVCDEENTVTLEIANSGSIPGTEIVQLYLDGKLKGFGRVTLQPSETRRIQFRLSPELTVRWSPESKRWRTVPGKHVIQIGASSQDIRQSAVWNLPGEVHSLPRRSAFFAEFKEL